MKLSNKLAYASLCRLVSCGLLLSGMRRPHGVLKRERPRWLNRWGNGTSIRPFFDQTAVYATAVVEGAILEAIVATPKDQWSWAVIGRHVTVSSYLESERLSLNAIGYIHILSPRGFRTDICKYPFVYTRSVHGVIFARRMPIRPLVILRVTASLLSDLMKEKRVRKLAR